MNNTIDEQDLFDLVKENKELDHVNYLGNHNYEVILNCNETFYIEKEPDLEDDRWFYWFNSRLLTLKEAWCEFKDIINNFNNENYE